MRAYSKNSASNKNACIKASISPKTSIISEMCLNEQFWKFLAFKTACKRFSGYRKHRTHSIHLRKKRSFIIGSNIQVTRLALKKQYFWFNGTANKQSFAKVRENGTTKSQNWNHTCYSSLTEAKSHRIQAAAAIYLKTDDWTKQAPKMDGLEIVSSKQQQNKTKVNERTNKQTNQRTSDRRSEENKNAFSGTARIYAIMITRSATPSKIVLC